MLFKKAFQLLTNLKLFLIPVLIFFWISSVFEHFLIKNIERVINSADPNTFSLIGFGLLHLLNGLLFPTLITLLALSRIRNDERLSPGYQIEPSPAEQLFIETLRSWGKSIWWFFVFILPGLYKFLSYSYVPQVVFLNPDYDRGTVDALEASTIQFRKRWFSTLFIFLVFYFVFPIMLSSLLDSYKDFNETPVLALLASAFTGGLNLFAFLLLVAVYQQDNRTPSTATTA
ncbi:MAG: hypothetical protein JNL11_10725 [Bdellovibrionaceae bacterium]|nr:hypothetical protein [Pseudobdellovibrionaceae bacterium]